MYGYYCAKNQLPKVGEYAKYLNSAWVPICDTISRIYTH